MKKIVCLCLVITMLGLQITNLNSYAVTETIESRTVEEEGFLGSFVVIVTSGYLLDTPNTPDIVPAKHVRYSFDQTQTIAEVNANTDTQYYVAMRVLPASPLYNCHSYAWYSQDFSSNCYRIDDPSQYYLDNSYYEVTNPIAGDIICYFDDGQTPSYYGDDENLHSGIVVSAISGAVSNGVCGNSNMFIVQSKFGIAGVYQHNGHQNPYTDYCLDVGEDSSEAERADYVKYYRKTNHTHSHSSCVQMDNNLDYHKCVCSCGQTIYEAHHWRSSNVYPAANASFISPLYVPRYICRDCGMMTLRLP